MYHEETKTLDFTAIRLKLASPEDIHRWSHGEVTKPETINYRTQKPEKDGLFAEEIFGPSKDWECYCGKYKRIRYKGIVCDKCGVEVTRSLVRRERMGHIDLASPVSHIWFLRGVPSKIGLVLDMSVQDLEKVIYFANFIITRVDEDLRKETLAQLETEADAKRKQLDGDAARQINERKSKFGSTQNPTAKEQKELDVDLKSIKALAAEQRKTLDTAVDNARKELRSLAPLQVVSEQAYQDLSLKYGHVFEASIGAEAIRKLLAEIDLGKLAKQIETEMNDTTENKRRRLIRRFRLVKSLENNKLRPEWTVLTSIPVIPPDLRPMVQLDGGRFATSDLNDLYRRVINRNNRLKRLVELNAPEVIQRNEKRMLQEAVDALIDNGARHGKTVTASTGQKRMLKSIADILKGKQGRFRQNLLGKRVDYSGRSVIVIGPHLKLHQCGIPKRMALELFRPFVISQLIKRELVHNVRSAGRYIEAGHPEIWDILEEVTKHAHVLLNRAPTLHRLGIQAFQPILIEGKAIQIHPMVCLAFNADFDGDQMAVHVPLTEEAKWEAREMMLSSRNILKPATGKPVVTPAQDIALGCYHLTYIQDIEKTRAFASPDEAEMAFAAGVIKLQTKIRVRVDGKILETSVGRIRFNAILPKEIRFVNETLGKKALSGIISRVLDTLGREATVELLDQIKRLSFETLTTSGISWGMDDLQTPKAKPGIVSAADAEVGKLQDEFDTGLLTEAERHARVIGVWTKVKDQITEASKEALDRHGPVFAMIDSGARGSWSQITQMMGMKGLVTNPGGETIELPVKGSFKEGFDVLEYFISTHGARKALSDTALRTANAGYLTRRLIDVAQDMVVSTEDCGEVEGIVLKKAEADEIGETVASRAIGRTLAKDVKAPRAKKALIKKGEIVTEDMAEKIAALDLPELRVFSLLTCKARRGVCQKCYGFDLGYNQPVELGTAVGIIAAQSIGEPGTQLTMRTFHTGGVAGEDITQGLPRVEELFEARPVKKPAIVADVSGPVEVEDKAGVRTVRIAHRKVFHDRFDLPTKRTKKTTFEILVKDGQKVSANTAVLEVNGGKVLTPHPGVVMVDEKGVEVSGERDDVKEFIVPPGYVLWVKSGDTVTMGDPLTEGSMNLFELFHLKGREAVQKYVIKEIQYIYSSQGQKLNDKHIEIIVRQMFARMFVEESGDTKLLAGEIVDTVEAEAANREAEAAGKTPARLEQLLLGITKASLTTESFLSAASFQETARVLIDAAVTGKVDTLKGLKENVIIGKLIPAGTGYADGNLAKRLGTYRKEYEARFEVERAEAEKRAAEAAQAAAMAAVPEGAIPAEIAPVTPAEA
jgi:DNA-directed RNA polymerase subunit beta'